MFNTLRRRATEQQETACINATLSRTQLANKIKRHSLLANCETKEEYTKIIKDIMTIANGINSGGVELIHDKLCSIKIEKNGTCRYPTLEAAEELEL